MDDYKYYASNNDSQYPDIRDSNAEYPNCTAYVKGRTFDVPKDRQFEVYFPESNQTRIMTKTEIAITCDTEKYPFYNVRYSKTNNSLHFTNIDSYGRYSTPIFNSLCQVRKILQENYDIIDSRVYTKSKNRAIEEENLYKFNSLADSELVFYFWDIAAPIKGEQLQKKDCQFYCYISRKAETRKKYYLYVSIDDKILADDYVATLKLAISKISAYIHQYVPIKKTDLENNKLTSPTLYTELTPMLKERAISFDFMKKLDIILSNIVYRYKSLSYELGMYGTKTNYNTNKVSLSSHSSVNIRIKKGNKIIIPTFYFDITSKQNIKIYRMICIFDYNGKNGTEEEVFEEEFYNLTDLSKRVSEIIKLADSYN